MKQKKDGVLPVRIQRASVRLLMAFVYGPVLMLLAATALVASMKQIPVAHFVRDSVAVTGAPFYVGAISNIGILLWCAVATMCFLTSTLLRRAHASPGKGRFLLSAGLLTSVLMLDDLFLFHEVISPRYLGLSSDVVLVVYGFMAVALFLRYRPIIYQSKYALLLLSVAFFGGSVVVDFLQDRGLLSLLGMASGDLHFLLEDGLKLLGIAGWFSYFGWVCHTSLARLIARGATIHGHDMASDLPLNGRDSEQKQPLSQLLLRRHHAPAGQ